MKIMILSDSHSMNKEDLLKLLNRHNVDYYIHCGDIFMTYQGLDLDNFYNVRGNNDRPPIPQDITMKIDGITFYIVHGHQFNVDFGIHELEDYAKKHHIDIVCFGHTHNPVYTIKNNITFINPGSVTYPRGKYRFPTYCLYDTQTKRVDFYDVKQRKICDPFCEEPKKSFSIFNLFKKKK